MPSRYNFAWLKDQTQHIVDANPLQADADFSTNRIEWAINEAANDELNKAKQETNPLFFLQRYEFTWPSGEATYSLTGTPLEYAEVYRYVQLSGTQKRATWVDFEYRDAKTLFWRYYQGPSSNTTLAAYYWPAANHMTDDEDEPSWIAPPYRNLIAWSAAILLREIADEQAPQGWIQRRQELRHNWWSSVQSRPEHDVARVTTQDDTFNLEGDSWFIYQFEDY